MCHPGGPEDDDAGSPRESIDLAVGAGEKMPATVARGRGAAPRGCVLVVSDIFGRSPLYLNLLDKFAAAGFTAILPDLFFREGALAEQTYEAAFARRSHHDETRAISDLSSALDWMRGQQGSAARQGTIGFCMGGTIALALSTEHEDLATVCFYGFPAGSARCVNPFTAPLDLVERMRGPILGFWGDQDANVGIDNVDALVTEARKDGVDFEHTVYPGLGHGFMAALNADAGAPGKEQAGEAWGRTLAFLDKHLTAG